jgi:hypothetical protein
MQKTIFTFLALCLIGAHSLKAQTAVDSASIQIIHNAADPAAASVDIYLNGELLLDNFAFRAATPFVSLPAGVDHSIAVAPPSSASVNEALATFTINLAPNSKNIAVANGVLAPSGFAANPDSENTAFTIWLNTTGQTSAINPSKVDVKVVHGSTDAPTVDVLVEGVTTPIVDNAKYGDITNYIEVDPLTYTLVVTPGNDNNTVVKKYTAPLTTAQGAAVVVFASGFLTPSANQNGPAFGLFACLPNGTVIELPEVAATADSASIQIIHNAADPLAASVDIYLNGALLLDNFAFRSATPFVTLEAGVDHSIAVAPSTSTSVSDALATFPINLAPNSKNVAIANGVVMPMSFANNPDGESTAFTIWLDTNAQTAATNATKVDVKVVHGSTDAPTVDVLVQGVTTPIVNDAKYGDITPYIEVDPVTYTLVITPGNDNNTVVKKYSAPLTTAQGAAAVVFASGFLTPSANQNGPAFGLYACLPNGTVIALPDVTTVSANSPSLANVNVYPNPASEFVAINNQSNDMLTAQLFDLSGKLISDLGVIDGNMYRTFSLDNITNGIYQVRVTNGKTVNSYKLAVSK